MKVQDILNYAITSSYSGASSISMDTLMVYLNIEYHRLAQLIKNEVRNDFFYEKFTTDLVAGQNEYSFEEATTDKIWIEKILSVDVQYRTGGSWQRLAYWDDTDTTQPLYDQEQSSEWMYDIKDSSLFLYPTPTVSVSNGLVVQAITSLVDLKSDGEESSIYPWHSELRAYHYLLGIGVRAHIFQQLGMYGEKNATLTEYERELNACLSSLRWRYKGAVTQTRPNLERLAK